MESYTSTSPMNPDRRSTNFTIANRKCSIFHTVREPASDLNKCLDRLFAPTLSTARQSLTQAPSSTLTFAFTVKPPTPEMLCRTKSSCGELAQPSFMRCSETWTQSRCLAEKDSCSHRTVFEHLGNLQLIRPVRPGMMTIALFIFILALNVAQSQSRSVGLCRGVPCANGGRLLVDNSVWGHCRCRCRSGFVGPYCQHVLAEKRSFETTTSVDQRRLSRPDALDRIRMRLLDLSQRLAAYQASVNGTTEASSNVHNSPRGYPEGGDIMSLLTNDEETDMDSTQYDRIRRSWFSTYFRR